MGALTGTVSTLNNGVARVGQAEDVHDIIYNISPTETPVLQMAKKFTATNVLHQWQTDSLSAAAANTHIEGDEATFATVAGPTMLGNYCNISKKTVMVSRTMDRAKKYGRGTEMGYLIKNAGKALKRDIELMLLGAQASSAGGAATARAAAGYRTMITGNAYYGDGNTKSADATTPGASSVGVWGAVVDGSTLQTFTQADLTSALGLSYTDGGNASVLVVNTFQKSKISAFSGATAFDGFGLDRGVAQGALIAGVDLFISDVGTHKVLLDRQMGQTAVLCLDPEYIGIAWFDPISVEDLAKTGDATKKQIVCEWAPVLQNPDAHAQVMGLLVT